MVDHHVTALREPPGPLGRLGCACARHRRLVLVGWALLAAGLGVLAPRTEHALSGAGWQADGSPSVAARELVGRHFAGQGSAALVVVVTAGRGTTGAAFTRAVEGGARALGDDPAVRTVVLVRRTGVGSPAGRVAVLRGGAADEPAAMVRAAGRVRERLRAVAAPGVRLALTGSPALWGQFDEENRRAMLRSEVLSWPLTLALLVVAFGSVAAAGLPLLLAVLGLVATAGALWLGTRLTGITIWALNFALMFGLAVGIDYALLIVVRFRAALRAGAGPLDAVGETMDGAGRAVALSGLAVLTSLSGVLLVPSQPFRTCAAGIALAVAFVLAATLTLLPAVLAWLGPRVDAGRLPWAAAIDDRSEAFARWGRLLARRPVLLGGAAAVLLVLLALPVLGLRTAMPTTAALPAGTEARVGYETLQRAFGAGAPAELEVVVDGAAAGRVARGLPRVPGVAAVAPPERRDGLALLRVQPDGDRPGALVERLRARLGPAAVVGGAAAEAHDLERALGRVTPLVYAVVFGLGFALLGVVVRAPVAAAVAVALNALATAAAFGVARLIFQDGLGASLLGFEPQGHLDAWAPVFFFCLMFALAMDYTVFLLATAREELLAGREARHAVTEALARSGRVINAAGAIMVVVFATFALSGPLAPKEMGVVLGIGVALDTVLVRLLLLPAALRLLGPRAWWTPRLALRAPVRVTP